MSVQLAASIVDQLRRNPLHTVLLELGQSARDMNLHGTEEFRKLEAYLLELADGRDRREPWTQKPGIARPVPKLRVTLEKCFGQYADLQWFRLNKTTNQSGMSLIGLFPRSAASLARVQPDDFGALVEALVNQNPDSALMRLLHARAGKLKGVGVELLSRLAYAFRRDLYFVIPREWGESSGCLKYIDGDLRKYCALCRTLRSVCDDLRIEPAMRGGIFLKLLEQEILPAQLQQALHRAIGPTMARFKVLAPTDGYVSNGPAEDPLEFAATSIRGRRGEQRLRNDLLRSTGARCAMTGASPIDLLEVAYLVPFPDGDVHSPSNTLLLRSDLHTLWDLNLVGIHPETLTVHVAPRLKGSIYENVAGRKIPSRDGAQRLSRDGLRERWTGFAGAASRDRATTTAGPSAPRPSNERRPGPQIQLEKPSALHRTS